MCFLFLLILSGVSLVLNVAVARGIVKTAFITGRLINGLFTSGNVKMKM